MWKCPTCGKEFVHQNENHTCEEIEKTIDAYISAQAEEVRPLLHQVRNTLRTALPEAQERISWRMPTYWSGHNIIHFAAFKKAYRGVSRGRGNGTFCRPIDRI